MSLPGFMEASDFLSDEEFSYFSTMISGPCQKLSFFLSLFLLLGKLFGQGTQDQIAVFTSGPRVRGSRAGVHWFNRFNWFNWFNLLYWFSEF
jgi:hypothetical protein